MTIIEDTWPMARKRHVCDVCCGRIEAGDRYSRQRGVYDGEPYTHRGHALCIAAYLLAIRENDLRTDWDEEVRPLIERFFAHLAAVHIGGADVRSEPSEPNRTSRGHDEVKGS